MKAVRLTTAFAVVLGVVLPLPAGRDLMPEVWAAEKDAPPGKDDLRQRAEDLAKSASDKFGEIVGGREGQSKTPPSADAVQRSGSAIGLAERVHIWTSRSAADYQDLMRGLSQAPQLNPVVEAAARLAAGRSQREARPQTLTLFEMVIGWVHRAAQQYQTVVQGLVSEPGRMVIAEKSPVVAAKQADDPRRVAEVQKAADAMKADEARVAAAKQADDAGRAEEARRAAEAQKVADAKKADEARIAAAKQAEDARRIAEAQKAADAKKADEARVAAAKQAEDARRADEARRVAEAQKAADAKKVDETRIVAAKQAEDARRTEEARRVAEAQRAADAKKADEARIAGAKQAEDIRRAEETRLVAEAQKAADAKKADETRIAAAKQADDVRRVDEARRAAEKSKAAETKRAEERRIAAADSKPAETKAADPQQAATTPSGKRTAAQRERKERAARMAGPSRKLAVASSRKRAKQAAAMGKGRRKKAAEVSCRMAGNRTNVPGWYVVQRGDTLWKIANRHYGKGRRYPVIYRANTRRIADPNRLVRCQRIYLPKFRRRG